MRAAEHWKDFEVLDTSGGEKLERWGNVILARPDPQIIWNTPKGDFWKKINARYLRSRSGGGSWEVRNMPAGSWTIGYRELTFKIQPTGFKHTGLFPEQAVNWDFMAEKIRAARKKDPNREVKVLNLFAYTGGATIACAKSGAAVTHVDAAKGMVLWAKENAASSGLSSAPIRYLVDDCMKFVEREIRRGNHYDAIIMDPPSYGRGPGGEVWKIEDSICHFVRRCALLLSDNPLFFVINSYTTGLSPTVLTNLMSICLPKGKIECGEIGLPITGSSMILPCGATGRWEA